MRLIDADALSEDIDQAQDSLMTNDDKMWDINKPYFKGLAWARGLINDAPTVNPYEWISVKDRLPEKRTRVLCYYKYEPESPDVICENDYLVGGLWSMNGSKVTHWMPLPPLPYTEEV